MADYVQVSFHYTNGTTESFNVYAMPGSDGDAAMPLAQCLQQALPKLLQKPWIFLQLAEETVCINMAQVDWLEVKPGIFGPDVDGMLGSAERLTPLTRNR